MKILVLGGQMGLQLGKTFLHKFILEKNILFQNQQVNCMKGIQVCLDKEAYPHKSEIIIKKSKYRVGSLKILVLKNHYYDPEKLRFT
jgi:hypothetical protein